MSLMWLAVFGAYALYALGVVTPHRESELLGFGLLITIMALSLTQIAHKIRGE